MNAQDKLRETREYVELVKELLLTWDIEKDPQLDESRWEKIWRWSGVRPVKDLSTLRYWIQEDQELADRLKMVNFKRHEIYGDLRIALSILENPIDFVDEQPTIFRKTKWKLGNLRFEVDTVYVLNKDLNGFDLDHIEVDCYEPREVLPCDDEVYHREKETIKIFDFLTKIYEFKK
jgi:hypothetical protein